MPQSSQLANRTANQNEAKTEPTKLAGKTKDAERPQSAIRNLKQKMKEQRTKNNKSKKREQDKVERDNKQLGTIESEEEDEKEEEEEIEPNRSEKTEIEQKGKNLEGEQEADQPRRKTPKGNETKHPQQNEDNDKEASQISLSRM